jgi:hypothetical protein
MAAGSTYSQIATTTLGSAAASYTFSNIPQTYTNLVLVCNVQTTTNQDALRAQFNSDIATNYSMTQLFSSTAVGSNRQSNQTGVRISNGAPNSGSEFATSTTHIFNYYNTTTFKTILSRANSNYITCEQVGLWRSTAAITSIKIYPENAGNLFTGSVLTLYGIKGA